ncbi:kelch-like protein 10 isoform X2 [Photinus pyralis]|uniref:kelch-like protein 10 isoform X2 n=1 Tax=Photinus pyralis TaxID=7054 RepID=UPI00126778D2|nr:kelch-like protein 10 isoform X2 [Photinus pyralis]
MTEFSMTTRSGARRAQLTLTKSLKATRKRQKSQSRRCLCLPQNLGLLEYSPVWNELRTSGQCCDGTVTCSDGTVFQVHRVILSAISTYFRAHFTNSLNPGASENTEANVSMPSNIFKCILDFAYTGFCNIEESNVEHLLKAADQYQVLGVIQLCCNYVLDRLNPMNCFGILRFAGHYFCTELEKEGRRFVRRNFERIVNEGSEFCDLSVDEVEAVLDDDELNVKCEKLVYHAVKRWITTNPETRKGNLLRLLKCVRFGNIAPDYISRKVLTWDLVADCQECVVYLHDVIVILEHGNGNESHPNPLWKPRIPYITLFAIGGWSAGCPTNIIETYDCRADRWLLSADRDDCGPRAYHGLCTLNGLIYMIGGFDGNSHFNSVRCFDPVKHKWSECACMYFPRCYVSVVMHDSKIYALGGYNGRTRMNSVERYDPKINQWEIVRPMLKQRSDASAAVLNDKIYIVGGFNGHEVMSSGEVYDTVSNQWTYIPSMLSPRSGVSLLPFKDSLYAIGGFNGHVRLATGEKYTPGSSANWVGIARMVHPRSNFATATIDDLLYVIGGFNGSSTVNVVERYNPDANEWHITSPMNLNRSALSACILNGLPNAKDYSYQFRPNEEGQGAGMPLEL